MLFILEGIKRTMNGNHLTLTGPGGGGPKLTPTPTRRTDGLGLAQTYLQLPLRQWGAVNVYLLVLSS